MDWTTWAATWGPAAPLLLFFLKVHYDLVYVILPRGLTKIRDQLETHEQIAGSRHEELCDLMRQLQQAVTIQTERCSAGKQRRRKKPAKK